MSTEQRKYATAKHPTIEALVNHLYKYVERKQALARFKNIQDNFVMSKEQPGGTPDDPIAVFWIKGFALTAEEEAQGYTGHYCEMRIGQNAKGQYILTAGKVPVPINKHPQKKRLQSKHPNWGHPIMRAVKKGKVYSTIEAASAELEQLHLEFPEVSIPGINKLFLIVYEKREGVKQPTRKIALELEAKGAGFVLTCKDNEKGAGKIPLSKEAPASAASDAPESEAAAAMRKSRERLPPGQKEAPKPVGGYTAQEIVRKKKRAMKRKKTDPRVSKKIAVNPHTGE